MIKVYLLLIGIIIFTASNYAQTNFSLGKNIISKHVVNDTIYRIVSVEDNTYGYDILVKNKLLIHQTVIPGVSGNKGFTKRNDAEKVARLVIKKMQRGIMPPTITISELNKLKVKY